MGGWWSILAHLVQEVLPTRPLRTAYLYLLGRRDGVEGEAGIRIGWSQMRWEVGDKHVIIKAVLKFNFVIKQKQN